MHIDFVYKGQQREKSFIPKLDDSVSVIWGRVGHAKKMRREANTL